MPRKYFSASVLVRSVFYRVAGIGQGGQQG